MRWYLKNVKTRVFIKLITDGLVCNVYYLPQPKMKNIPVISITFTGFTVIAPSDFSEQASSGGQNFCFQCTSNPESMINLILKIEYMFELESFVYYLFLVCEKQNRIYDVVYLLLVELFNPGVIFWKCKSKTLRKKFFS